MGHYSEDLTGYEERLFAIQSELQSLAQHAVKASIAHGEEVVIVVLDIYSEYQEPVFQLFEEEIIDHNLSREEQFPNGLFTGLSDEGAIHLARVLQRNGYEKINPQVTPGMVKCIFFYRLGIYSADILPQDHIGH